MLSLTRPRTQPSPSLQLHRALIILLVPPRVVYVYDDAYTRTPLAACLVCVCVSYLVPSPRTSLWVTWPPMMSIIHCVCSLHAATSGEKRCGPLSTAVTFAS